LRILRQGDATLNGGDVSRGLGGVQRKILDAVAGRGGEVSKWTIYWALADESRDTEESEAFGVPTRRLSRSFTQKVRTALKKLSEGEDSYLSCKLRKLRQSELAFVYPDHTAAVETRKVRKFLMPALVKLKSAKRGMLFFAVHNKHSQENHAMDLIYGHYSDRVKNIAPIYDQWKSLRSDLVRELDGRWDRRLMAFLAQATYYMDGPESPFDGINGKFVGMSNPEVSLYDVSQSLIDDGISVAGKCRYFTETLFPIEFMDSISVKADFLYRFVDGFTDKGASNGRLKDDVIESLLELHEDELRKIPGHSRPKLVVRNGMDECLRQHNRHPGDGCSPLLIHAIQKDAVTKSKFYSMNE
jgi:hypothetical protein